MGTPNALRALGPAWFRFTDPDDMAKYGDGWYTYDESKILRLRARELIRLESLLGMPLIAVMNGFRESTVLGDTAAAWLGVRFEDEDRAGDFDDFSIRTMFIEWSKTAPTPAENEVPKDEPTPVDTPVPQESSSPMEAGSSGSTNSAPTDTVALQTLPIAE